MHKGICCFSFRMLTYKLATGKERVKILTNAVIDRRGNTESNSKTLAQGSWTVQELNQSGSYRKVGYSPVSPQRFKYPLHLKIRIHFNLKLVYIFLYNIHIICLK